MIIGLFTDKAQRPTDAQVHEAIGPRLPLWQTLLQFIRDQYSVQEDFRFMYGEKYGWALRFRIKKRLLIALYPAQGGFTAQVILKPDAIKKAQRMKPSRNVQQAIDRAHPYPEGRWLFIPIEAKKDLRDFQLLVELRASAACGGKKKVPAIV
jgi:hypothetical protein